MTDEDGAAVVQELSQRACPWTDPDECAVARERAVAGITDLILPCEVHADPPWLASDQRPHATERP